MIMMRTRARIGRRALWSPGLAVFLFLGGAFGIEAAQQAAPALQQQTELPPRPSETAQNLHLIVGHSLVITSPARIKRVSLADPNIADAVIVSPYQILINGKQPGSVSLLLWDEADQSQAFDVYVDLDILALNQKIHEVFPSEPVQLEASKEVVMLSGRISSKVVADKVYQVVSSAIPKVVNLMEVPAAPSSGEILLEVKFAEVDRAALSQLGINILSLPPAKNIGSISTQQFAPPQLPAGTPLTGQTGGFALSDLLNVFVFRPDINLAATIKALQQKNVLQILAEPNLLAETGTEASFLAGGEFPFPIVQGGGAGTLPTITIVFKEFGVRLNFKPDLTEDGRIHLKVRPEVSSLDFTNAVTFSGFFIPALSTRRVESNMVLEDGQSFAIAGLVDDRLTETASKIPGLGDIPILGHLFKSRSLNKSKNELLVVVTPHVVQPIPASEKRPALQFPKPFLLPTPTPPGPK